MMENFCELGERNGLIYVSASPADTFAEFYTEEQNDEMKEMIQQVPSVQESFVMRK